MSGPPEIAEACRVKTWEPSSLLAIANAAALTKEMLGGCNGSESVLGVEFGGGSEVGVEVGDWSDVGVEAGSGSTIGVLSEIEGHDVGTGPSMRAVWNLMLL
jgi:hypothetical protein